MRATRAFVGAFGAGVSLAIASSLMLLVVSSVIAFNGWPDDLEGSSAPEIAALSDASDRARSSASSRVLAIALPPAVAGRASAKDQQADGAAGTTFGTLDQTASSTESAASGTTTGAAADPSSTSSASPVLAAKTDPAGQAGDTIRDSTGAVADVVEPVAPAVSGALQSVGAAGADTTDHVVGTALQP